MQRWLLTSIALLGMSASSLAQTAELRQRLPLLLQHIGAQSLLDAPCGDFNWMRETELDLDMYIGVDVVFDVILANRIRYANPRRQFLMRDLTRDPLPGSALHSPGRPG